jgi:hypothetical protein
VTTDLDDDISDAQYILQYYNQSSDFLPNRTESLDVEVVYSAINLRDQVRKGEDTPLQFVYDAADCRIFFTPKTVFNLAALWKYAADAIWAKPELCVKDSTGYATTNASDTKLPPVAVLPATTVVESPPVKLGAVIHNIFAPDSGIGAGTNIKPGSGNTNAVPAIAPPCTAGPGDSLQCPKNYYCDRNYKFCSKQNPGIKKARPGCVKMCAHYGADFKCSTGGTCRALPEDLETQLDSTGRGYCSPAAKSQSVTCKRGANSNSVTPGAAGRPVKRDEFSEED